jgi:TRAP-type C4-dicarboxylate transport system permease small subunit
MRARRVYLACIWVAGLSIFVMSLIIPWGMFTRYVLGTGSQWPEPIAILLMVVFTFIGAAAAYRAGGHIAVAMLTDRLCPPGLQVLRLAGARADAGGGGCSCGGLRHRLCMETMGQTSAELPWLPVGATYMPLPLGGLVTLVFVLEHMVFGSQHHRAVVPSTTKRPNTEAADGRLRPAGQLRVLMLIGMPVAYALGLSALVGALWIDLPLDAVMIQIASGVNKFSLLAIPFFVLAGAIMAEGGMARRLVAFAGVLVGFMCAAGCRW